MVSKLGRSFSPLGKVSFPWRHFPIRLTIPLQRDSQSLCMTCYPSVLWAGCLFPWGCLPWHIAMGLERQGEKTQKPKRSKKGHCKSRASSMQSMCTLFYRVFQLHQPGAAWAGVRGELTAVAAPTGTSAPHQDLVMRWQHHHCHPHPTWVIWQSQAPWY